MAEVKGQLIDTMNHFVSLSHFNRTGRSKDLQSVSFVVSLSTADVTVPACAGLLCDKAGVLEDRKKEMMTV